MDFLKQHSNFSRKTNPSVQDLFTILLKITEKLLVFNAVNANILLAIVICVVLYEIMEFQLMKKLNLSVLIVVVALLAGQTVVQAKEMSATAKKNWKTVGITTAVGAGAGAATGAISRESTVGKGAVVGAVTGLGVGATETVGVLKNKPLLKRGIQGSITGLGASTILNKNKLGGAAIGAGAGVGTGLIEREIKRK